MRNIVENAQWRIRALLFLMLDIVVIEVSAFLALWIRFEFVFSDIDRNFLETIYRYAPFNIIFTVLIFYFFHLYTSLWKYASVNELISIGAAVAMSGITNYAVMNLMGCAIPRSYPVLYVLILAVFTIGSRFCYRFVRFTYNEYQNKKKSRKMSWSSEQVMREQSSQKKCESVNMRKKASAVL